MQLKKVLIVGPLPPEAGGRNKGGVAYHVWHLSSALAKRGLDVKSLPIGRYAGGISGRASIAFGGGVLKRIAGTARGFLLACKVIWTIRKDLTARGFVHALANGMRIAGIKEALGSFDVVHVHGCYNAALPLLRECGCGLLVVTVHSYHGLEKLPRDHRKCRFFRANAQCADAIINVSQDNAKVGRELGLVGETPSYVVHNGVAKSAGGDDSGRRGSVVFVGSLIPRKRPGLLVAAWRELAFRDVPLEVVGEGPGREAICQNSGDNSGLTYHGVLNNEQTRRVMRGSYVLAVPSLSESFGLVYVEAMMEGTAVIGYGPVIQEFQHVLDLDDEERALVVPLPTGELSPRELARMIDGVLEARQSPWGEVAMERIRKKAEKTFSRDEVSERIITVYDEVIRREAATEANRW